MYNIPLVNPYSQSAWPNKQSLQPLNSHATAASELDSTPLCTELCNRSWNVSPITVGESPCLVRCLQYFFSFYIGLIWNQVWRWKRRCSSDCGEFRSWWHFRVGPGIHEGTNEIAQSPMGIIYFCTWTLTMTYSIPQYSKQLGINRFAHQTYLCPSAQLGAAATDTPMNMNNINDRRQTRHHFTNRQIFLGNNIELAKVCMHVCICMYLYSVCVVPFEYIGVIWNTTYI